MWMNTHRAKRRLVNSRNTAARKIQVAFRNRKAIRNAEAKYGKSVNKNVLRLPRNYENNVIGIPINNRVVAKFREGQGRRYVSHMAMNAMKEGKRYVSALSKQPIKNFKLKRVKYYNVVKNKNKEAKNKKNLENKMKNESKKQNNMRKGKALLNPIVHMNQTNQNAQVARQLQEEFILQAAANNQQVHLYNAALRMRHEQEYAAREQARRNQERRNIASRLRSQVHNYTPQHLTRDQVNLISGVIGRNYSNWNIQNRNGFTPTDKSLISLYLGQARRRRNIPTLTLINKALRHINRVRNQKIDEEIEKALTMQYEGATQQERKEGRRRYEELSRNLEKLNIPPSR